MGVAVQEERREEGVETRHSGNKDTWGRGGERHTDESDGNRCWRMDVEGCYHLSLPKGRRLHLHGLSDDVRRMAFWH